MENLIEKTNLKNMSKSIVLLMDLITSSGSYVPKQFFFMYELARIDIENEVLG